MEVHATPLVIDFSKADGKRKDLFGGKGANLASMSQQGFPVPPGFIISTEACRKYWEDPEKLMNQIWEDIRSAVRDLEKETEKTFGGTEGMPLLVSVRSGAPISMPGMMDTILNLGINHDVAEHLGEISENPRFAWDSYRRFISMYATVVAGLEDELFEHPLFDLKNRLGVTYDYEVEEASLRELVKQYLEIYKKNAGAPFPQDPWEQLRSAVEAVFRSWDTPRAKAYRKINKISRDLGTAVNVVSMVYGNLGDDCGTGVCFTRNPSTGEKGLNGEYLMNAQGEDVVAGIRTPEDIKSMKDRMPHLYDELVATGEKLERFYKDMQDIEFTVERGVLYILQTRNAKRTARAAVTVAVDMVEEGLISPQTALLRVTPEQAEQLLHNRIDPEAELSPVAQGLPASPGAAIGKVIFDPDEAEEAAKKGEKVILVRPETTPDDVHGLFAAQGALTSRGGMTSHAAVVARGMGKPCVSGCDEINISMESGQFTARGHIVKKGDVITLDGSRGLVFLGEAPLIRPSFDETFQKLLSLADRQANLEVWANADTPGDAQKAMEFGAKGIGLCRTEHMFMQPERLKIMQEMILAQSLEERQEALAKLQVMQEEDFLGIFRAMKGYPVTVRLLDPPLHEFLPQEADILEQLEEAEKGKNQKEKEKLLQIREKARNLRENNPMLGFRGCRLGVIYPEIYEMQVRAILGAACTLKEEKTSVDPHIMFPLVGTLREMELMKELTEKVAREVFESRGNSLHYHIGSMIEVPRAALVAGEVGEIAEFFSFGTNDLTQTTFGYSRDDAEGKFLAQYVQKHVLPANPFHSLDVAGVGRLMKLAVKESREIRKDIKLGICGEHGGDPESIRFCEELALAYVSCSPYRIPVARLAAAHAVLEKQ
ncbi:MAG TPA: pyruvate, phosphate dikinase [Synergistaceae bacterium]|nr:pyruvate, phosphate dikinase [Synergistaceae bacterium]HPQ37317.1 pyruvate, phosphate dikinase [Synergistaceae bacterium]